MIGYAICFYLLLNVFVHSEICSDDYCDSDSNETQIDPIRQFKRVDEYLFEGDMLGFNNIEDILRTRPDDEDIQDNALTDESKKWVDGIVYYKISELFSCSELCIIHEAMHEMEQKTCLNFVEDDHREDVIQILLAHVCASYVGRQGNRQKLYLSPQCAMVTGQVIHELMHAVGFFHEQSRRDRNNYIHVNLDNVPAIYHPHFIAHGLGANVTTHGLPYDYESVMHYEPYAFARNKSVMTITAIHGQKIGQRERLSNLDSQRINIHYDCSNGTFGCRDTYAHCGKQKNLQSSCRVRPFLSKCQKTCGSGWNCRHLRVKSADAHCQTPADRCSKLSESTKCPSDGKEFERIQKLNCYQFCQNCP